MFLFEDMSAEIRQELLIGCAIDKKDKTKQKNSTFYATACVSERECACEWKRIGIIGTLMKWFRCLEKVALLTGTRDEMMLTAELTNDCEDSLYAGVKVTRDAPKRRSKNLMNGVRVRVNGQLSEFQHLPTVSVRTSCLIGRTSASTKVQNGFDLVVEGIIRHRVARLLMYTNSLSDKVKSFTTRVMSEIKSSQN